MIFILYVVIIAVVITALLLSRNRKTIDIRETSYDAPSHVDRRDFPECNSDTFIIAFTSSACDSCSDVIVKAKSACSEYVTFSNIEYEDLRGKKLHKKYDIDAVPTLIICDKNGDTTYSSIGQFSATDLWTAVAQARQESIGQH